MVRIRSDRWYSGENQKELRRLALSNSGGTRRLISLIFLLALVLVLMAKLSDPQIMRQMFRALGVPFEQAVVASTHQDTTSPSLKPTELQSPSNSNSDWDKTCLDLIPRLLEKASPQQIDQLAEFWFASNKAGSRERRIVAELDLEATPIIAALRERLEGQSNVSQHWNDLLTNFDARWQQLIREAKLFHDGTSEERSELFKDPKDEFNQRMSEYLDRRLLESFRNGSPWSASELVGFGRFLQKGKNYQFGEVDPPLVTTKQLLGDFAKLQGSWIGFRATVRLVESIEREQPLVDQSSYHVLWLRGVDGAAQPIPAYTTSSIANQLKQSLSPNSFPEVYVVGLVGKKLAYGSASGVEVSPTLFAGSIVQFAPDLADQLAPPEGALARQVGIAGVTILVLGLLAVAYVWKQLKSKHSNRTVGRAFKLSIILGLLAAGTLDSPVAGAQDPPWKETQTGDDIKLQVVQQRLSGSFEESQIQQIRQLIDGADTRVSDSILKTLFALNQVGWNSIWQSQATIPVGSGCTLRPIELNGIAWSVQPLPLTSNQQEWFSVQPIKQIYRIQVQSSSETTQPPKLTTVFCREVPKLWRESIQLKQPIQLRCYAFSPESKLQDSEAPMFCLAERVSWKMSSADLQDPSQLRPTISANWLELAQWDWDFSWFDLLASNSQKKLAMDEIDPLLKLLEMTARPTLPSGSPGPVTLVQPIDCMKNPIEHIAAPIDWQVRLVTGSVVEPSRKDGAARYYQLDGFVKIPNQTVNYAVPDSGQSITFENEFPVTIVTYSDREFVPLDKLKAGERTWPIGRMARVQGRFVRLWSYESQRLKTADTTSRQIAPLVAAGIITESNTLPEVSQKSLLSVILLGCAMLSVMGWVLRDFLKKSTRSRRSLSK